MSSEGSTIDAEQLRAFLAVRLDAPITPLVPLKGGNFSSAFAFTAGERELVARINVANTSFERDRYAGERFASTEIPIPRVLEIDRLDDVEATWAGGARWYAISERAPGVTVDTLAPAEYARVLPALLDSLDAIHRIGVAETTGYGSWTEPGVGSRLSWREYISTYGAGPDIDSRVDEFVGSGLLERDLCARTREAVLALLDRCPDERTLVHGDFGFDNTLTDGSRVTGVIDWADVGYGDPLFDVAWLSFWSDNAAIDSLLAERYGHQDRYQERTACYRCSIGLSALLFFAEHTDRYPDALVWAHQRVRALLL